MRLQQERSGFDPGVKLDLTFAKKSLHVNFLFSYFAFLVGEGQNREPLSPNLNVIAFSHIPCDRQRLTANPDILI
ncbi:hypothetical protein VN97_g9525 [Penicillium thymicola]|uniref:Uncharacterized protein n=1 Tax=Penicillium thymicola TaxID=293382 RepID=A0AAI9TB19_PENTH|nr:hypothetical protein VN97_g9525 [Penicillium thymicola]